MRKGAKGYEEDAMRVIDAWESWLTGMEERHYHIWNMERGVGLRKERT